MRLSYHSVLVHSIAKVQADILTACDLHRVSCSNDFWRTFGLLSLLKEIKYAYVTY